MQTSFKMFFGSFWFCFLKKKKEEEKLLTKQLKFKMLIMVI